MKKKQTIKGKKPFNSFAVGGNILDNIKLGQQGDKAAQQAAMSQGLGVAGGVMDLTSSAIGNLQTEKYNVANFNAGSLDSLQGQASGYIAPKAQVESVAGNAAQGALKGAKAGMAFGPWGAAIGAGVGLLSEGITTAIGNRKEREAAAKANAQSIMNINNNAQNIQQMDALKQQQSYFATGGKIRIKPENKGKFTAWANAHDMGVQEAANHIMANKEDYSSTLIKRANFAKNAAGWSHAEGGPFMASIPVGNKRMTAMNELNQSNTFAEGGEFSNGVNIFNNGGTHEENPNGGIPQGIGPNGLPNLVEEGEVKYKNYIFSNRLKANTSTLGVSGLPDKFKGKTFGEIANRLQKESQERPNDPISQRGLADMMKRLKDSQETTKAKKQAAMMPMQVMAKGGNLFVGGGFNVQSPDPLKIGQELGAQVQQNIKQELINAPIQNNDTSFDLNESDLRYAPVIASGLQTFTDQAGWTNKADTTLADTISRQSVRAPRLTDKMTYTPLDTQYIQNQATAQQAATRQGILNTSGGNRATAAANLLAADYGAGLQSGALARQAAEYAESQKQRVMDFNRATNQYNAEADKWEQSTKMQNVIQGAQLREQINQQAAAVRNQNLNNFLGNITGVGQEAYNRNMITSNPALYYTLDKSGKVTYKQADVARYAKENNITPAQAIQIFNQDAASKAVNNSK